MQEYIYMDLRRSLMHGHYEPGQLLTIKSLSDEFGCSAMPVREALRQLSVENGLEALPNGTIQVPQVDQERLHDLYLARLNLEDMATAMACERIDEALLRRLRRLVAEHELAIQHDGIYPSLEKNYDFHFLIYAASGSRVLPQLIETVWLQYGPYMRVISQYVEVHAQARFQKNGTNHHHALIEALAKGDSAAARAAMLADINGTYEMLVILLRQDSPDLIEAGHA